MLCLSGFELYACCMPLQFVFVTFQQSFLGSGTMFLRPEEIHKHHSLATVDIEKLKELLIK